VPQPNRRGGLQVQQALIDREGPGDRTVLLILLDFDLAIGAGHARKPDARIRSRPLSSSPGSSLRSRSSNASNGPWAPLQPAPSWLAIASA